MDMKKKTIPANDPHFQPSPAKKIRFADGEVRELNRKERRARKIYNRDLRPG